MNEELELFLEDMDEQLSIMEGALLDIAEIEIEDIDKEMINKIFRAMHTMKGNAGIFGYDDIINFAHVAENLLDEIRNDKIILTQEIIELFLLINDHSRILIETTTQDKQLNQLQQQEHDNLVEKLKNILDPTSNQETKTAKKEEKTASTDNQSGKYIITVKLQDDFFTSGMSMLSIVKYLEAIGTTTKVTLIDKDIPSLYDLDPLKAYINLEIEYETKENISEIEEAFEFVIEDIELTIKIKDEDIEVEEVQTQQESPKEFFVFKKVEKKKPKEKIEEPSKNILENNFKLKVDSLKIDKLINQISEMVIANAKITQYALGSKNSDLEESVEIMSEMLEEVRDGIMNIRMVQVGDSLNKLRRIVTDIAKKTGKEISFEIIGGDTELDKTVIEKISDPLVHILRNSVDHGIEMPGVRKQAKKDTKGSITLKAYPDSGSIVIEIQDDGKGLDKELIYNKAVEKNLIKPNEKLSDKEIYNLILKAGFSTAQVVTDISGRGVGMDVVKRNIDDLRGVVEIDSQLGLGTTITIRLPLTLAIIDGFLVQSGDSKYIIPLANIQECIELKGEAKKQLDTKGYMTLRSDILPVLDIGEYFEHSSDQQCRKNIVVVKYGTSSVGLKVDQLHGEFQTVIKPLGNLFKNVSGILGGTILGNGDVALIFDIQKLIEYKITNKEKENGN
jgi:two-component system chemotaxis sensor kinase CheA